MGLIKLVILAGVIRLLVETENALLCAGLYTAVSFVFNLMLGTALLANLISTGITFGWTFGWFWLLTRFADTGTWWLILVIGLVGPATLVFLIA